jgi:hypothetical protein
MVIKSPFTTAAVGMGVGEGGNGVLVDKIGVADGAVDPPSPHPLIRMIEIISMKKIFLNFWSTFICVDYNASTGCIEGNLNFRKITL